MSYYSDFNHSLHACKAAKAAMVTVPAPVQDAKYPLPVSTNGPRNVTRHAMMIQHIESMARAPKYANACTDPVFFSYAKTSKRKTIVTQARAKAYTASLLSTSSLMGGMVARRSTNEDASDPMTAPRPFTEDPSAFAVIPIAMALP
mmetsp:Transcript_20613/g.35411  ORF Transcript_20613/g.35411 Transcript_20613/m.35411 type:complete len:146 (-) Transcript_20613:583-1020(-)